MDKRNFPLFGKNYLGTKKYYWHGFFVKREYVVTNGRKTAEQISIQKIKKL